MSSADFHVCPHGPCAQPLVTAQGVVHRLEALMQRCREEAYRPTYSDLLEVLRGTPATAATAATAAEIGNHPV